MNQKPLKTVIIGFGGIAAGYAKDTLMHRYYPYATHAQVLKDHPQFEWVGIVESDPIVAATAKSEWSIANVYSTVEELARHINPEIAIIATPPNERFSIIKHMPSLRGVLVEKPLGLTLREASMFTDYCQQHSLIAEINFWRRTDVLFNRLAKGLLFELIGEVQAIFGVYGNGLKNNGSHLIDFIRFMCGEIQAVQSVTQRYLDYQSPIATDTHVAFDLLLQDKIAHFQPINFSHYRECSVDIWGETGRLSIVQEGMKVLHYACKNNRATQGCFEIASDQPKEIDSTVGHALYHMYTNLADALLNGAPQKSSIMEGLKNIQIIDAIQKSEGNLVPLPSEVVSYEL